MSGSIERVKGKLDEEVEKEGVDSMMGRLNLLADEMDIVEMSDDEDGDDSAPEKWSLVGKVLSPNVVHIQSIRAAMRPAWGNPRGLRIKPGGDNVFVADFPNKADRDWVLAGTPWMVGRHAVLLQDLDPRIRPSDVRFDTMSIWARIHDLPFGWMNNKRGLKVAKIIDKGCSVDVDEFGEASGTFLRARVAIPIDQPLRRWVMVRRDGKDERFILQYEKLPFYCFSCGLIGHGELECKTPADRDASGKLPFDRDLRVPDEHKRRVQSFGQAAASASWNSGSKEKGTGSKKSGPNSATSSSLGGVNALKAGEQEVNSPPAKGKGEKEQSKVSEIARQLFPGEAGTQVIAQKKRKPAADGALLGGQVVEGAEINMIDNDLSLAIVPVGGASAAVGAPPLVGFDDSQGHEKKFKSEMALSQGKQLLDAGLPFQPCTDQ
ncbi:hypothetical protein QYE76_013612 [Lolium multiflorum]|uniref:CCHC-type domain-containing protein n=1 Tax=Lolium multiflorum TaxID=4521 RepID=A0AAD8U3E2_LOLMU|nr:hypothetical protein QYE76_013612 [Lolium multiflorum]